MKLKGQIHEKLIVLYSSTCIFVCVCFSQIHKECETKEKGEEEAEEEEEEEEVTVVVC